MSKIAHKILPKIAIKNFQILLCIFLAVYDTWKLYPELQESTMWVQITPNYIFANIFSSECSILFL